MRSPLPRRVPRESAAFAQLSLCALVLLLDYAAMMQLVPRRDVSEGAHAYFGTVRNSAACRRFLIHVTIEKAGRLAHGFVFCGEVGERKFIEIGSSYVIILLPSRKWTLVGPRETERAHSENPF